MSNEVGATPEKPLWMALSGAQRPRLKDIVIVTAISVAPIAIAILMQKPALRQAIAMRFFHYSKETAQEIADVFQILATKAANGYQKAQL